MRSLVRLGVKTYQRTLSPLLSCLAGPAGGCRFDPTCSDYFLQAVEKDRIAVAVRARIIRMRIVYWDAGRDRGVVWN